MNVDGRPVPGPRPREPHGNGGSQSVRVARCHGEALPSQDGGMRVLRGMALAVLAAAAVAAAPSPASARGPVEVGAGGIAVVRDEVLSDDGRLHELTLAQRRARAADARSGCCSPPGTTSRRTGDPLPDAAAPARRRQQRAHLDREHRHRGPDQRARADRGDARGRQRGLLLRLARRPAVGDLPPRELLPWVDADLPHRRDARGRAGRGALDGRLRLGVVRLARTRTCSWRWPRSPARSTSPAAAWWRRPRSRALGYADDRRWGPYLTHEANWRGHNPPDLAPNLRGMAVQLTTGTGVPCEGDSGVDRTEAGVSILTTASPSRCNGRGVPYDLVLRPCGTHQWHYWERDLAAWLPKAMALFAEPPAPPAAFAFRTTDGPRRGVGLVVLRAPARHRVPRPAGGLARGPPRDRQRPGRRRDAAGLRARRDVLDRRRRGPAW